MENKILKTGFVAGVLAFGATVGYVVVQILQLLRVTAFPADEVLIFGTSQCIVIPFMLLMLALHYATPPAKKFWTHAAVLFTVLYAVFVTANYTVQLATVLPMKLRGQGQEITVLHQAPHSMFWDYDALGYIFMGLAMLAAVPAFDRTGFQKKVRTAFLANGLVTPLIAVVYFYPRFSETLLVLAYPWAVTAPLAMLLLALSFKKEYARTRKTVASTHRASMLST